jgi:uncharacterized protein YjdB
MTMCHTLNVYYFNKELLMQKFFSLLMVAVLTTACSVTEVVRGPVLPADSVVSVVVTPNVATLLVGQQQAFVALPKNALGLDIPDKQITWSSTTPSVATVNSSGRATGVAPGTTTIRATVDGVVGISPVAVAVAPVSAVVFTPSSAQVFFGQTFTPTVELRGPSDQVLTGRLVEWTSLNTNIATVNQLGVITTVGVGTVTIRASSEGRSANFTLTVNTRPPATVVIARPQHVHIGRNMQLDLQLRDAQGQLLPLTGRTIRWSSDNTGIATVTNTGLVRGIASGPISIAALVDDRLAVLNTTVTAVDIDTLVVNLADNSASPTDTIMVRVGFTRQFATVARDVDGVVIDNVAMAGRTVTWSADPTGFIAVSNTGLVTGIAPGNATLQASVNGVVTRRHILVVF